MWFSVVQTSHNALRMNYITNRRLSRELVVASGVHCVKSTVSLKFIVKIMRFRPCVRVNVAMSLCEASLKEAAL